MSAPSFPLGNHPDGTDTLYCKECEGTVSPADNHVPPHKPGDNCPDCVPTITQVFALIELGMTCLGEECPKALFCHLSNDPSVLARTPRYRVAPADLIGTVVDDIGECYTVGTRIGTLTVNKSDVTIKVVPAPEEYLI